MQNENRTKRSRLEQVLDKGMAKIRLNATMPGVNLPDAYMGFVDIALNLSYNFDPPDLTLSDWGFRGTLSFNKNNFKVAVPWESVFIISCYRTEDYWQYADTPNENPATKVTDKPRHLKVIR